MFDSTTLRLTSAPPASRLGLVGALVAVTVLCIGCTRSGPRARFIREIEWAERGTWMKVDTHIHSEYSDGAYGISEIAARAHEYGCDAIAITDHADRSRTAATVEYFDSIDVARRQFPGLTILAGLEWNVPPWGGDEHATVLLPEGFDLELAEFKERFDDHGRDHHDPERAVQALRWLAEHTHTDGTQPIVLQNHPSRMCESSLEVIDTHHKWRGINGIVVGFSGAPGHQAGTVNGAYERELTIDRWDPVVARYGDAWDQLLKGGLDVWAARAPSDFHSDSGSGEVTDYWPGQFSETWVYAPERTPNGILRALRAGSFFAGHGHIVREVDLMVDAPGLPRPAYCGETIEVSPSQPVRVDLRCRIPVLDWLDEPNRIDTVELIAVTADSATVVATARPASSGITRLLAMEVPADGMVLRARGRRVNSDGPDLLFYTNPIRISVPDTADTLWQASSQLPLRVVAGASIGVLVLLSLGMHIFKRQKQAASPVYRTVSDFLAAANTADASSESRYSTKCVHADRPEILNRWFLGLAIVTAAFSVYVSLLPFKFESLSIASAWRQFLDNLDGMPAWHGGGRVDFFANVLLLMPFGFGMMGWKQASWSRPLSAFLTASLTLAIAIAIGIVNELGQAALPRRVPSPFDAGAQVLGTFFGIVLWLITGNRVACWFIAFRRSQRQPERLELILRGYFVVLFLISVVPLDLTLHPGDLLEKYHRGRISLVPFENFALDGPTILEFAFHGLCFVPVGMLALRLFTAPRRPTRSLIEATLIAAGLVAFIEVVQLLVFSRFTETTDLIFGTVGAFVGAWIGKYALFKNLYSASPTSGATAWWWVGIATLYLTIPCCYLWWPFEFSDDSHFIRAQLDGLMRLPFQSLAISSSPLSAISLIVERTLLFIPFGVFLGNALQQILPRQQRGRFVLLGLLTTATLSAFLEAGQLFIPQRIPDITDILLATAGGAVGLLISHRLTILQNQPVDQPVTG